MGPGKLSHTYYAFIKIRVLSGLGIYLVEPPPVVALEAVG